MPDEPNSASTAATSIDIDLYCLSCGYNLRGLSGDPVRCPECGRSYARAAWPRLEQTHRERAVRRLQRSAEGSLLGVLTVLLGALIGLYATNKALVLVPVGAAVGLHQVRRFVALVGANRRAWAVLLRGWMWYAVGLVLGFSIMVMALIGMGWTISEGPPSARVALSALSVAVLTLAFLAVGKLSEWCVRRARAAFDAAVAPRDGSTDSRD